MAKHWCMWPAKGRIAAQPWQFVWEKWRHEWNNSVLVLFLATQKMLYCLYFQKAFCILWFVKISQVVGSLFETVYFLVKWLLKENCCNALLMQNYPINQTFQVKGTSGSSIWHLSSWGVCTVLRYWSYENILYHPHVFVSSLAMETQWGRAMQMTNWLPGQSHMIARLLVNENWYTLPSGSYDCFAIICVITHPWIHMCAFKHIWPSSVSCCCP